MTLDIIHQCLERELNFSSLEPKKRKEGRGRENKKWLDPTRWENKLTFFTRTQMVLNFGAATINLKS